MSAAVDFLAKRQIAGCCGCEEWLCTCGDDSAPGERPEWETRADFLTENGRDEEDGDA